MTPLQELIELIKQRINDDEAIPYMYNERILELAESLLEKEKEAFMFYGYQCCQMTKQKNAWSLEVLYNETFNTKEK